MNLSQLAESDARREEAQLRVRHHAALIAGIVCRIWQGRTRIGPSVRQRPPRFSNITESVGCLHVPHQVVPGTFVDYAFLFFLLSASGGWVKIKLDLHLRTRVGYVLCTTYVQPRISSYVPGMSRIPRYVYVGTYVPGLHPKKKRTEGLLMKLLQKNKKIQ